MARCRLDDQDRAALRKLDDGFAISPDGLSAKVEGEMEVAITRPAADRFQMTLKFPSGEELEAGIARVQLLEQLDIES